MIRVLEDDAGLRALRPEWEALWRAAGSPPFQSPAWLLPWWDRFGTAQPLVATLRVGGALRAMLPMYRLDAGGERKLLPIGVGLSDYLDALAGPGVAPTDIDALLAALLDTARGDGVTSCALPDLPPDAALGRAVLPPGWRESALPETPCPVLDLAAGAGAVPAGRWRDIRQARHRAGRSGGWTARVATMAAEAAAAWDALCRMHQARWGDGGVLADPAAAAFHRHAVPTLAEAGQLRMQVLRQGDRITAVYQTLTAPGRLLFYLGGFDEREAFVSPGTLLMGHVIEQALAEGVRELHFLRGGEAYKYAWGARDRMNTGRVLIPAHG